MSPDPLALRIVRRHRAAAVPRDVPTTSFCLEFWGGRIALINLKLALEPLVGYLAKLRFRPLAGLPATVAWEGGTANGELVTGTLVLHAGVAEDHVATWGEVTVDR